MLTFAKSLLPGSLKKSLKQVLRYPTPYAFNASKHVQSQAVLLNLGLTSVEVAGNGLMPLYDTVFEVIDDDCYGVSKLSKIGFAPDIVIDVGSNIGIFAIWAYHNYPDARFICFEPSETNLRYLRKNIEQFDAPDKFEIRDAAVTSTDGTVSFTQGPLGVDGGLLRLPKDGIGVETVNSVDFREILSGLPDQERIFVKMDIEGGEFDVLFNLESKHFEKIDVLSLEVHDLDQSRNLMTILNLLQANGFSTECEADSWSRFGLNQVIAIKRQ